MPDCKTTYHHGDLRRALIQGAIAAIAERDPSQLSLRAIARRIGVSHAAPYRHFTDKEALLAAVAEEGFRGLTAALHQSIAANSHPLHQLEATGLAYVDYALSHPHHYRVMFGGCQGPPERYPELEAAGEVAFQIMVELIATGQAAGAIRAGDPCELAQIAWAQVHGLAMLAIDGYLPCSSCSSERSIGELAAAATRVLIEGFAARAGLAAC